MDTKNNKNNKPCAKWPSAAQLIDDQQSNELHQACLARFLELLKQEKLDNDMLPLLSNVYLPLAAWIAARHQNKPLVIGINGAQGSGKSTLCKILKALLSQAFNKSVLELSIDDLYLSRHDRLQLADKIHPLLKVRGVPGTHDVTLANEIINKVIHSPADTNIQIPVFDKANDDRLAENAWRNIKTPVDIILFEGWCVGADAQAESDLAKPVNSLESEEDPDAMWRHYVNQQLKGSYRSLFGNIDYLIMLKVPDIDCVFEWRGLQENKLAEICKENNMPGDHLMTPAEISRFVMHYERITRSVLNEMPERADVLLELNRQHQIDNIILGDAS